MGKAYLHMRDIHGVGGNARCYRVEPPVELGGREYDYVLIKVQQPWHHVEAKVHVFPANEHGRQDQRTSKEYAGSHVAKGNPFSDPAHMEGCYWFALLVLDRELQPDTPVNLEHPDRV